MTFNWTIVIFVIIALVAADKLITLANINAVENNFPEVNKLNIEKNPVSRWFFEKFGLNCGMFLLGILSVLLNIIAIFLIHWSLKSIGVTNSLSIGLYAVMMIYGLVITNNFYFFLKYSKIVP